MILFGYYKAKIFSKLFHNHEYMIDFFRKQGMEIGQNCHIYSNIVTPESYLIRIGSNVTFSNSIQTNYIIPIKSIIISIIFVFVIIGIIMRFAIKKINKQNIIETIRNDNI